MAHPRLLTTTHRKALTVGMTAALLALPMAGAGAAATLPGTDALLDEESDATGLLGAVDGALTGAEELVEPVTETTKTVIEAAAPVTEQLAPVTEKLEPVTKPVEETVEKIVEPTPVGPPASDGGSSPVPGSGGSNGGGVESATGGNAQPVNEPVASTRSADRPTTVQAAGSQDGATTITAESAPPALRHEFNAGGMRSSNGGLTLQPFQAPIVSNPFASQAPQVADDGITSTPVPSVAQAFEASVTEIPRQMTEQGVPGGLTATAAGLLLLVGAGHLMHRSGHLRRVVAG